MRFLLIIATVAIATLVGCTKPVHKLDRTIVAQSIAPGKPESRESPSSSQPSTSDTVNPSVSFMTFVPSRLAIVESASRLVGARTIMSQGKRIAYDCAGVTRAIFLEHGIDLYRGHFNDLKGNGVRLIYNHVRQHGILHQGAGVRPGDLIFFDNTWDFNGDGKLNDPLTHVGIVEHLDHDGTVVFISRVADSIARYRMNLSLPHVHKNADGRVFNDYIRRKYPTDPGNTARLTGELFSSYGNLLDTERSGSPDDTLSRNRSRRQAAVSPFSAVPER